jgi:hypothetical protein
MNYVLIIKDISELYAVPWKIYIHNLSFVCPIMC